MGRRAQRKRFWKAANEALRRRPVLPPPQTEAEIALWWLTRGCVPPDHCFLASDRFCIWSPEQAELLLVEVLDGDPVVHEACQAYLRRSGAAFPTVEAVLPEVQRRGLPGAGAAAPGT